MATKREPSAFVAARGPPCRHRRDRARIDAARQPHASIEEGVLIDNDLLVDEGHFREAEMRALLACGRMAGAQSGPQHLRPQGAARRLHARRGSACADRARLRAEVVAAYMRHVLANAEESVRRLLGRLDDGEFDYEMDNGAHVRVKITHRQGRRVRRRSTSPAPATSCPTISTRHSRSSAPPRSMSCAR